MLSILFSLRLDRLCRPYHFSSIFPSFRAHWYLYIPDLLLGEEGTGRMCVTRGGLKNDKLTRVSFREKRKNGGNTYELNDRPVESATTLDWNNFSYINDTLNFA